MLTEQDVRKIFVKLAKNYENPKSELQSKNHVTFLVSVVLSAQTTDKMVNRCMKPQYQKGFTVKTLLKLGNRK